MSLSTLCQVFVGGGGTDAVAGGIIVRLSAPPKPDAQESLEVAEFVPDFSAIVFFKKRNVMIEVLDNKLLSPLDIFVDIA